MEADEGVAAEGDLDEADFDAIMRAVDAAEALEPAAGTAPQKPRVRREKLPLPEVGSANAGRWRTLSGDELNGRVEKVDGGKVYGMHTSPCGRCDGQGGSDHWPGYTCFDCGGSATSTREVRLYTPDEIAAYRDGKARKNAAKVAESNRRSAEYQSRARDEAATFRSAHPELFKALADYRLAASLDVVADVLDKLDRHGYLSDGQVNLLESMVARRRKKDADAVTSEWRWHEGDRVEVDVVWRASWETNFAFAGRQTRRENHLSSDDAGNLITFKTSNFLGAKRGDRLSIKGTVKAHEVRDGAKRTRLERVLVLNHRRLADLERIVAESRAEDGEEPVAPAP